ncbi:hypothetical protein ACEWY4_017300 [Coilia grayii]|uniref:EGF-like domain-containing protein n=1 Tax=Coilia grayii TaxID=363190 RepID=A0ABD1JJB4_9TELE
MAGGSLAAELDPCEQYTNLSDPWRNTGYSSAASALWPRNDSALQEGWYRFSGVGGDVLDYPCIRSPSEGVQRLGVCKILGYQRLFREVTLGLCVKTSGGCPEVGNVTVKICSAGYYLHLLTPTAANQSYSTRHLDCQESSCGEHAQCGRFGTCVCKPGYVIPEGHIPTGDDFGCSDIDCEQYTDLSDPWRNTGYSSAASALWPRNDSALQEGWYRFSGVGGDVLDYPCIRSPSEGVQRVGVCQELGYQPPREGTLGLCVKTSGGCPEVGNVTVKICSAGYYLHLLTPTAANQSYSTRHLQCQDSSCGEHAQCGDFGACGCTPGYVIPEGHIPTGDDFGCSDIDECRLNRCGADSECVNSQGSYQCVCVSGYMPKPLNDTLMCIEQHDLAASAKCKNKIPAECYIDSLIDVINRSTRMPEHFMAATLKPMWESLHNLSSDARVTVDKKVRIANRVLRGIEHLLDAVASADVTNTKHYEVNTRSVGRYTKAVCAGWWY